MRGILKREDGDYDGGGWVVCCIKFSQLAQFVQLAAHWDISDNAQCWLDMRGVLKREDGDYNGGGWVVCRIKFTQLAQSVRLAAH